MIFQKHPRHGRHIAYSPQEAEANRKNGWIDISNNEFFNIPESERGVVEVAPIKKRKVNGNG